MNFETASTPPRIRLRVLAQAGGYMEFEFREDYADGSYCLTYFPAVRASAGFLLGPVPDDEDVARFIAMSERLESRGVRRRRALLHDFDRGNGVDMTDRSGSASADRLALALQKARADWGDSVLGGKQEALRVVDAAHDLILELYARQLTETPWGAVEYLQDARDAFAEAVLGDRGAVHADGVGPGRES